MVLNTQEKRGGDGRGITSEKQQKETNPHVELSVFHKSQLITPPSFPVPPPKPPPSVHLILPHSYSRVLHSPSYTITWNDHTASSSFLLHPSSLLLSFLPIHIHSLYFLPSFLDTYNRTASSSLIPPSSLLPSSLPRHITWPTTRPQRPYMRSRAPLPR